MRSAETQPQAQSPLDSLQAHHDRLERRVAELERQMKSILERLTEDELSSIDRVEG
jgi:hypothetical protein